MCEYGDNFPEFEKEDDLTKEELAELIGIERMEENIETLGHKRCWEIIERNFKKPETRLAYRDLFFKAGGIVPKKEI